MQKNHVTIQLQLIVPNINEGSSLDEYNQILLATGYPNEFDNQRDQRDQKVKKVSSRTISDSNNNQIESLDNSATMIE